MVDNKEFIVNIQGAMTKSEIQDRIESSLPLPAHYGRNLDALYDALQEISGAITFEGLYESEWNQLEDFIDELKLTLRDAEMDNPNLEIYMM